jgi:hypothetical protein
MKQQQYATMGQKFSKNDINNQESWRYPMDLQPIIPRECDGQAMRRSSKTSWIFGALKKKWDEENKVKC